MRKVISFLFLNLLIVSNIIANADNDPVDKIISTVKENLNKLPGNKIAVIDFSSIDGSTNVKGKLLAEQIIAKLVQVKGVKVVERKQIDKILKENELVAAGLTTGESSDIGKLSAADVILTGTIAELDDDDNITAKLLSPKTGEIFCAVNIKMRREKMKNSMVKNLKGKDREKAIKEFNRIEDMKRRNPDRFEAMVKFRKRLMYLQKEKPKLFRKIIRLVRTLENMKYEHPKLFLLVTAPQNQRTTRYLNSLKNKSPELYKKVIRARIGLKLIVDKSPAYKRKIIFDRKEVLVRLKNGKY